ncbi:MAG: hypothetical protein K2X93_23180 [Candidatus Obscuribacterales bacterium]|nr:hypothetical protein [Candidatus Obscuribacterales bacterium]
MKNSSLITASPAVAIEVGNPVPGWRENKMEENQRSKRLRIKGLKKPTTGRSRR